MKRKVIQFIAKLLGQQIIFLDQKDLVKVDEEIYQRKTLRSKVTVDNNLLMSARTKSQIEYVKLRMFTEALNSMIKDFSESTVWYRTDRGIESEYEIEFTVLVPKSNKPPFIDTLPFIS